MDFTKDTPISSLLYDDAMNEVYDALLHGTDVCYIDLDDDEMMHWKYIKREKLPNGKWRYYYDWNELKNNTKNTVEKVKDDVKNTADTVKNKIKTKIKDAVDKTKDDALKEANKLSTTVNSMVDKGKNIINKVFYNPKNIYDITSASYSEKLAKVKASKEWQDIVKNGDAEYVKKNKDGSVTYLIDDYIVDKKHPVIDMIGDIVAGRKVDTNDINKDTVVAGLKDYAMGAIRTGMLTMTVVSTFLNEKFKLQQGTYDDKVAELTNTIKEGETYVNDILEITKNSVDTAASVADTLDVALDNAKKTTSDASKAAKDINNTIKSMTADSDKYSAVSSAVVKTVASAIVEASNASKAKNSLDEGNIVQAAQIFMQSDLLKATMGDNEYYKLCESTLTNLSPSEVAALNLLLKQLRS